jgi:ribosome assembly protein SQT1
VAWHPKGDVVLAGSEDFTLWMWLAQSGNCMQVGGCFQATAVH